MFLILLTSWVVLVQTICIQVLGIYGGTAVNTTELLF